MSKCQGVLGWLLGHKFSERYSEGRPTITGLRNCDPIDAAVLVRATKPLTYHHDVCERCGAVQKGDLTK